MKKPCFSAVFICSNHIFVCISQDAKNKVQVGFKLGVSVLNVFGTGMLSVLGLLGGLGLLGLLSVFGLGWGFGCLGFCGAFGSLDANIGFFRRAGFFGWVWSVGCVECAESVRFVGFMLSWSGVGCIGCYKFAGCVGMLCAFGLLCVWVRQVCWVCWVCQVCWVC